MLPGMMPMPGFMGAAAVAFSVVAQGVGTVAATSFALNPSALGAAPGDLMVVAALFETDSAITHPASWTVAVEQEAPAATITAQVIVDWLIFGAVPGAQSWSYAGELGVAYAWVILRGAASIGAAVFSESSEATAGQVDTTMTIGSKAAFIACLYDSNTEAGETATLSGVNAGQSVGAGHAAGRYAMCGTRLSSGTASYTTSVFARRNGQQVVVPIN